MKSKLIKAVVCLSLIGMVLTIACAGGKSPAPSGSTFLLPWVEPETLGQAPLKRFSSYEELVDFVKANSPVRLYYGGYYAAAIQTPFALRQGSAESAAPDYSTTNIQVEGVDEADILKTDGEYIYLSVGQKIVIVKAYPPEEARVLSEITLEGSLKGIFINEDRLVVFEESSSSS